MELDGISEGETAMSLLRSQVREFHRACGHPVAEGPTYPSDERMRLRARLIAEEALECIEAIFDMQTRLEGPGGLGELASTKLRAVRRHLACIIDQADVDTNAVALADGLADLDFVVEGARVEMGLDGDPIAREVYRANLTKAGAGQRDDGKQQKPKDWQPPDIAGELRKQGWRV